MTAANIRSSNYSLSIRPKRTLDCKHTCVSVCVCVRACLCVRLCVRMRESGHACVHAFLHLCVRERAIHEIILFMCAYKSRQMSLYSVFTFRSRFSDGESSKTHQSHTADGEPRILNTSSGHHQQKASSYTLQICTSTNCFISDR